ncbi:hypothetical protein K449DRAFT_437377 [Hypoxylon sp. EC38]|nr:hypothetical protein K449DRAFT_437377 [Hypoxylon sp. EC38]
MVVHTASSSNSRLASNLIKALGQRQKASGEETFFIHVSLYIVSSLVTSLDASQSSVTSIYSEEGGWPYEEVRDTDPVFEKEKEIGRPHPVRETNILVAEQAKAHGVTRFIVVVSSVYGRGSGEWRRLSVNIPAYIRTSIAHKIVYKFDKDGSPPAVHISDLTAFYALLMEKILNKEPILSGEKGYYFAFAHRQPWWEVMQRLANALYARELVAEPKGQVWPSYEMAAEVLGFPHMHIRAIGTSSGQLVPVNAYRLGWQPKWDKERFLESLDDEVQAVLELDTIKPTLFDSLLSSD